MDHEQLLQMRTRTDDPVLNERLQAMISESREKRLKISESNLTYHNQVLPIKNAKVKTNLEKIRENSKNLQTILKEDGDRDRIFQFYSEIFGYYDDAIKIVGQEKSDTVTPISHPISSFKDKRKGKIHLPEHSELSEGTKASKSQ